MPELDNTIQVEIRPEDIEMQVYRSSGAGGQHINKTVLRRPSDPQAHRHRVDLPDPAQPVAEP